jgi:4-coumarate--CoA ligase
MLTNDPIVQQYDLSSLQMFSSGAAPLSWDLTRKVYARIKVPIKQAYGLSETSPTSHSQEWKDWNVYPGSAGKLLANCEAKYINEDGNPLEVGSTGEICIRGPNIFQGYWRNPEATAHSFDAEGFFKTGDIGHEDEHGNIFITDRAKELIKYKGFQVAPAELEGLLNTHPRVRDAAVIGVYREDIASEVPRAYLVVDEEAMSEAEKDNLGEEIQEWIAAKIAYHKRLRGGVVFVAEVPKSPSGKILRRVLRDAAKQQCERARARL